MIGQLCWSQLTVKGDLSLFKRERKKNKDLNNGYRTTITTKLQKEWCKRIPLIEFSSKNLLKSSVSSVWCAVFIDFNRWAVFSCDISLWRRLHLWDQFPDLLLPPLGPRLTLWTLNFTLPRNHCSVHLLENAHTYTHFGWYSEIRSHSSRDMSSRIKVRKPLNALLNSAQFGKRPS